MSNPNQEPIIAESGTFQRVRELGVKPLGDYKGASRFVYSGIDRFEGDNRDQWPRRASITLRGRSRRPSIHYEFTIDSNETVSNLTAREHQVNDIVGKPLEPPSFQDMLREIDIAEKNQTRRLRATA